MRKKLITRTINPLHFEDLEPHRFEDLIRQLAYSYRPWRYLEATGRLGKDEGIDIRGIEVIPFQSELTQVNLESDVEDDFLQPAIEEREWRVQCKRYKSINPKLMRSIVAETVPEPMRGPYGLIVAAACDVSAQSIAAFHDERLKRGVLEGHLWTKAHLEDLLFRPENDHLLFAYFGISLGAKRRSQLQQIQSMITVKRKLLRALKKDSIQNLHNDNILIRDISDSHYPDEKQIAGYDRIQFPPWFTAVILQAYPSGLIISRFSYNGWKTQDGKWDFLPDTAYEGSTLRNRYKRKIQSPEEREKEFERRDRLRNFYEKYVPERERVSIQVARFLPFASIMEIDSIGDIIYEGPQLFCRYGVSGPYENERMLFFNRGRLGDGQWLDAKDHKPLFASTVDKDQLSENEEPIEFIEKLLD
jgi:hypothetical protein